MAESPQSRSFRTPARADPPRRRRRCLGILAAAAMAACSGDYVAAGVTTTGPTAATKRYVAPTGDDRADGSLARPWRTLARALPALGAGEMLVLRGGNYRERNLRVQVRSTAAAPTVIASMPGEVAVLDAAFAEFEQSPAAQWTVHDAARGVFRSALAYPSLERAYGRLPDRDGGHALVPYAEYAALAADREDYDDQQPYHAGPGVHWSAADGHVYVRLARSRYQLRMGYAVPPVPLPTAVPLRIVGNQPLLTIGAFSAHLVLERLVLRGGAIAVEIETDCRGIRLQDCQIEAGRYGVLARGDSSDLTFTGLTVDGHFPPWVARSDVKMPSGRAPARYLQGSALQLEGRVDRVAIARSRFVQLFDAIDTNGTPTHLAIHDNEFTTIRDDVFEMATAGYEIDFHHNRAEVVAAAVSWTGSNAPPRAYAGRKFVRANLIDTTTRQLYGRDDPAGQLPAAWRGPGNDGMATGRAFGSHDAESLDGPDPWKVYHNTILGAVDVDGEGLGIGYRFAAHDAAVPHEVLNNVLIGEADHWLCSHARPADGSQVFDGNVWFRPTATPTTPLLRAIDGSGNGRDFGGLATFRASPLWSATQAYYAPGWEALGVESDPGLDDLRQPDPLGPAASPGVDLSTRDWPGAAQLGYRGALPPR